MSRASLLILCVCLLAGCGPDHLKDIVTANDLPVPEIKQTPLPADQNDWNRLVAVPPQLPQAKKVEMSMRTESLLDRQTQDQIARQAEGPLAALSLQPGKQSVVPDVTRFAESSSVRDFASVGALSAWLARTQNDPRPVIDAIEYAENVSRGGAVTHAEAMFQVYFALAAQPDLLAFPISPQVARETRARLANVRKNSTPPESFLETERLVRLQRMAKVAQANIEGARNNMPREESALAYMKKDKRPVYQAWEEYLHAVAEQMAKPRHQAVFPPVPDTLTGEFSDESMQEKAVVQLADSFAFRHALLDLIEIRLAQAAGEPVPELTDPYTGHPYILRQTAALSPGPNKNTAPDQAPDGKIKPLNRPFDIVLSW